MAPSNNTSPLAPSLRTKSTGTTTPTTRTDDGIITLRYEETLPAKPPIPVTVAPPRAPPTDTHPALRRVEEREEDKGKRDSGLAPTTSSKAREGSEMGEKDDGALGFINFGSSIPPTPQSPSTVPATPNIKKSESIGSGSMSRWRKPGSRKGSLPKTPPSNAKMASPSEEEFSPITTPIPTDSLMDAEFLDQLSFSKRGSVMFGGKKAVNGQARQNLGRRQPSFSMLASPSIRVLSDDLEMESKKVRSMYEAGSGLDWEEGRFQSMDDHLNAEQETATVILES